jgi:hypothetical protein
MMKRKVRVYICSPYTFGDKIDNVNRQLIASNELLNRGFAPYTPLLTHYQSVAFPRSEHDWLDLDFNYLVICDMVIRIRPIIDGKELPSSGGDKEEQLANEEKIPVFTFNTIEEMIGFLDENSFVLDENDEVKMND